MSEVKNIDEKATFEKIREDLLRPVKPNTGGIMPGLLVR